MNKNKKELAIVLVSGGMDSCVTAAIAKEQHSLAFLHVHYGQRTQKREYQAFSSIADFFTISLRLVCNLDYLAQIGGSSLTDTTIPVPQADLTNQHIPISYVPFRNTQILSVAVSWGEVIGAKKIYIGAVQDDSSGYPDCRERFFHSFNALIKEGTRPETDITVVTPLIHMKKKEIVQTGIALSAPFELTWSCYQNEDIPCNTCDSCSYRKKGFEEAGVLDPIFLSRK